MSLRRTPHPLLRGYGPLVVLVVAFTVMALLVPTDARERVVVAQGGAAASSGPAGSSGPGAQAAAGGKAGAGGSITTGGGGSAGSGPNTAASNGKPPAHTKRCQGAQVPGDPYSPPCLLFHGNNDGATARGVTASTITVAYRETNDPGFQQTLAQIGGAQFQDTQADVRRTIDGLADYFNKHFQFYGRKLKFVFYKG